MTAQSGNNTANVLHNFDERGERIHKINVGMSDLIRSSEEAFFRMFYDLEVLVCGDSIEIIVLLLMIPKALPIYYEMVHAIISFEQNDKVLCGSRLENITYRLRHLLQVFYKNLTESRVSHSVWSSYVQGFQGWGISTEVDSKLVRYDELSGNHVLFSQALDAFLGMDSYLTNENIVRYIPVNQRRLCLVLKKFSFRNKLKG